MAKRCSFETCMEALIREVNSETFITMARNSPKDFTRKRKMGLTSYIWYFLQHSARSLCTGLHAFQQVIHEDSDGITKQAFSKGRKRINPEAINYLAGFTRDQFYSTSEVLHWNGYRLLAIDGSKVNLPTSPELLEHFGCQPGSGEQVQALGSCLYDVLNKVMIHGLLEPVWSNERDLALRHSEAYTEDINAKVSQNTVGTVVLFDRGYPSAHMIEELKKKKMKFAMRCSSEFLRSVRRSGSDCIVEHKFNAIEEKLRFRVIEITLDNGGPEYIVTDLFDKSLTVEDFRELYHFRWEIETAYDTMKNKFLMEDFTGRTVDAVLQDFYATLTSMNVMACTIYDNREKIEEQQKDSDNKYKYVQNINQTIGIMRNMLLDIVDSRSVCKRKKLYLKLLTDACKNPVAVRSGRSFLRKVRHKSSHYPQNIKRA